MTVGKVFQDVSIYRVILKKIQGHFIGILSLRHPKSTTTKKRQK
jgi:hypothetical protein